MARRGASQGEPKNNAEALQLLSGRLKASIGRPNIIRYEPHNKQLKFHTAEQQGRMFLGGNRSGKTTGGIAEDIFWLTGKHPYRATPPPPIRGRIVGVDFLNGIEKILKPELARWVPLSELRGGTWSTAYDNQLRTLHFENGSFVEFMSYDQDLDKFAGTSRHFIHFDEEPPSHIFTENKTRLIDTAGSWWLTMTPVEGMTWVYDDIYLPGKTKPEAGIFVVEVDMTENPHLHQGEVESFISGLSKEDVDIRKSGKFIAAGGLIYKQFDTDLHVIDPITPEPDELWLMGLDHGFTNPTAAIWASVNGDGRVLIFGEHYESGQTVDYHAKYIREREINYKREPDLRIADPSLAKTDGITGTNVFTEYAKHNLFFIPGNNDVVAGINRVIQYIKPGSGGEGKPLLYITRNCVNLISEMQRYRWATFASRSIGADKNHKEVAHKKFDHACDALRYMLMSRPDLRLEPSPTNRLVLPNGMNAVQPASDYDESLREPPVGRDNDWTITDDYLGAIW